MISEEEGEMIQSIFSFHDTVVREIMIPRTDCVTASVETPVDGLLELIIQEGHSRIPVYADNIDNIVGILHAKDLLSSWGKNEIDLQSTLRTPYFIPETKKVSQLLKELRSKKSHMAIVIDEYGGFAGLVTIEDIIEEIIGEIHDEYDAEETLLVSTPEGDLLVDARLDVDDLAKHLQIEAPEGDFESVGGLIISILGRVPQIQETVTYGNLEMVIESADARKIDKVRIRLQQPEESSEESPPQP
ncbi:MAG: HlyC/CorC family transporter [Deltaproteobacteria bacterium]|nr:HlyC/CorC family transporter [Deltaproteobacteria bacterium]MBW2072714.1 HlyC/CorC family transporter [Deltaproteobacteria bacterium]